MDGDTFVAPAKIPPIRLADISTLAAEIGKAEKLRQKLEAIADVFDQILTPESAPRFRERILSNDGDVAFDLNEQVMPLLQWLMEEYGLRPTQPSPPSSDGPSDGGTGLTDTVPNGA